MKSRDKAILMEKTSDMYKRHNIFPIHIREFGNPIEILQAFEMFYQDDGTRNSSIYPNWLKDNKTRLKISFKIKSLSGTSSPYIVPVLYKIIDYEQEPYLVDFKERPKTKTFQDDLNWINEIDEPTHQEILIRLWSENRLQDYTKKQKQMKKLKSSYKMKRKYVGGPRTPWYVTDAIPEDVMITYNELKKQKRQRKISSFDMAFAVCDALERELK